MFVFNFSTSLSYIWITEGEDVEYDVQDNNGKVSASNVSGPAGVDVLGSQPSRSSLNGMRRRDPRDGNPRRFDPDNDESKSYPRERRNE